MNFSKLIYDSEAAAMALDKLSKNASSLNSIYSNLKDASEESITNNFCGIIKCNQILSDMRTLASITKNSEKCSEIEALISKALNSITSNLNDIALELEPEEYSLDLSNIFQILNDNNLQVFDKNHFIFPKSNSIVIGTTMDCGEKKIVFTTVYTDSNLYKYLNLLTTPVHLENYDYGVQLDNNLEEILNNLINKSSKKIDQLIKDSTVFDNYIKSSVADGVNTEKAFKFLTEYFSPILEQSHLQKNTFLFKFQSKLNSKNINNIINILKLKNNDKYKFMALLKE